MTVQLVCLLNNIFIISLVCITIRYFFFFFSLNCTNSVSVCRRMINGRHDVLRFWCHSLGFYCRNPHVLRTFCIYLLKKPLIPSLARCLLGSFTFLHVIGEDCFVISSSKSWFIFFCFHVWYIHLWIFHPFFCFHAAFMSLFLEQV